MAAAAASARGLAAATADGSGLEQQQQQQPPPQLVVRLAGLQQHEHQQQASQPAGSAGAWLQLSPDTMHAHRLRSQQQVLVGVCCGAAAPGGPPAAASPSTPAAAVVSAFGPAAADLSPADAVLVDLWQLGGYASSPADAATTSSSVNTKPWRFLLPVTLWPSATLARGSALLSTAAWSGLLQPADGSHLALYTRPPAAAVAAVAASSQDAAELQLHMCLDPPGQHLLSSSQLQQQQQQPQHAVSPGFSTPVRGAKLAPSSSSKKGGSSAKRGGRSSRKGGAAQLDGDAAGDAAGGGSGGAAAAAAAAQWQLQLLQGGLDWSKPRQRRLLQQLLHRHLMGCCFLPGNVALLPVLGVRLLFHLQPSAAAAAAVQAEDAGGQRSSVAQLQQVCPLLITSSTRLSLQPPATAASLAQSGAATSGQQPGPADSTSGASLLQARVEAARKAAQQAVVASSQDAAMDAAERAVRADAGGYSRLGGIASYSQALRELVLLPLQLPQLFAKYKLRPPRGVLLHGPPGSGKTALARAAAVEAGATLLVVNGPDVVSEFYGESEAGLAGIFAAAGALAPAVVFIDELDSLAPSRDAGGHGGASAHTAAAGGGGGGSAAGEAAARLLTQLLVLMDGLGSSSGSSSSSSSSSSSGQGPGSPAAGVPAATASRVVVIGATNRPAAIDPALRRPGRFERELEVGVPDPAAREDILRVRLTSVRHSLTDEQVQQLAAHSQGFVGADLAALVNEAALTALRRHVAALPLQQMPPATNTQQQQQQEVPCVSWQDFQAARLLVRPSALRDVAVEAPRVGWDDVGGLAAVKQRLQEAVLWPQSHGAALARLGATPPKGVLLYGPPGCSKTLLARAVAASARLNFLSVKGGELYSSYVGESERAVAALFARARAAAPAVIFFDELDGLVGARGDGGGSGSDGAGGVGERVLAQLLTELDGLQPRLGVVVLAATNRPDKVDAALLRPGRFDRLLLVPPPDAAGRREIFGVHTRATPLAPDVDLDQLAARAEGYTGADISAVVREAALAALDEDLTAGEVCCRHFDLALLRVQPSERPSDDLMARYSAFQRHSGLQAL